MKPTAWYDPTNGMVSTDKDSPLFTPLGQVWPLYIQAEQEPVAWRAKNFYENQEGWFYAEWHQNGLTPQVAELLYTTPPQRTWAGLTDEELADCMDMSIQKICRAIEAKLKEKNT